MGGFKLVMTIERAVGKKPRRTWKEEWVDVGGEEKLDGRAAARSSRRAAATPSRSDWTTTNIKWKVDHGWPQEQAEAYTVLGHCWRCRRRARSSDRYAASTHLVCDALAQLAKQMTGPRRSLQEPDRAFGLATDDPAWEALTQPGASAGLGFLTNGVGVGL